MGRGDQKNSSSRPRNILPLLEPFRVLCINLFEDLYLLYFLNFGIFVLQRD